MPTATITSQGVYDKRWPMYLYVRYNNVDHYNLGDTFEFSTGSILSIGIEPSYTSTNWEILEDGNVLTDKATDGRSYITYSYTLPDNDINIDLRYGSSTTTWAAEIINIHKTYNKFIMGGKTYLDLSTDTVTAESLMQGYTAHDRNGAPITGTIVDGNTMSYGITDGTLPLVGVAKAGYAEI